MNKDQARLRVAVAQPMTLPGDVGGNLDRMEPLIADAAAQGASLVVFSECGITGYDYAGVSAAEALTLDAAALGRVDAMAARRGIVVVAGFFEQDGGARYNTAGVFYPDGRRVIQRKHNVTGRERQATGIRAGERRRHLFTVGGLRLGIVICSDSGIDHIFDELAEAGCDASVGMTGGLGDASKGFHQRDLENEQTFEAYLDAAESVCFPRGAVKRAHRLRIGSITCNQQGYEPSINYFHPGHSAVVDRGGEVTALIPGRFVFEHLRPRLAVGFVRARDPAPRPAPAAGARRAPAAGMEPSK